MGQNKIKAESFKNKIQLFEFGVPYDKNGWLRGFVKLKQFLKSEKNSEVGGGGQTPTRIWFFF